jgi:predicted nucleic acid-binding protein
MIRVFVDASVLFAAAYSVTGASREIIQYAIRGEIGLVISNLVLDEVKRNLQDKVPGAIADFDYFRDAVEFELVLPSKSEIEAAMQDCAAKDAPIVAAAKTADVDYLVSLDRRHLVGVPEVAAGSDLKIVLPGDLLEVIRNRSEE